jgi:hypothetical protein
MIGMTTEEFFVPFTILPKLFINRKDFWRLINGVPPSTFHPEIPLNMTENVELTPDRHTMKGEFRNTSTGDRA